MERVTTQQQTHNECGTLDVVKPAQKSFTDINELQEQIMQVVSQWVRMEKTPIAHGYLVDHLVESGVKKSTAVNAIGSLIRKGYIRRSASISNRTFYTQLRSV